MSDEETRAQYYQAHRDDPEDWGEPERPPASPKRRLASMISVRFSPDEADMVRRAAEAADESLSQFVRKAALQRCQHHHYVMVSISGAGGTIIGTPAASATKGSPEAIQGSQWIPKNVADSSTAGYVQLVTSTGKA
jgi:hypothetical protein